MGLYGALKAVEIGGPAGAWRELRTRVDVATATGVRHALSRLAQDVRHAEQSGTNRTVLREMWASAAAALGAEIVDLGDGFLEITRGDSRTRVYDKVPPFNDEVAVQLANDKSLVYRLLRRAPVQVPDHLEFSSGDLAPAYEFLEQDAAPYVVKPARDTGDGSGVTSQIHERRDLRRAVRWAARFGDRIIIERQVEGVVYRVLVLDGTVLDVVRRHPPSVTGDGRSTVAELVRAEYERRLDAGGVLGAKPLVVDLDCLLTLRRSGLTAGSVVEQGRTVPVKTVTNQNRAEDNETVREQISDGLTDDALASAATVGLRFAGVDVVAGFLEPTGERGRVVIDVNARPGLLHHYRVRDPSAATDVAGEILSRLLDIERRS
jgi:cyanophycin synthetase